MKNLKQCFVVTVMAVLLSLVLPGQQSLAGESNTADLIKQVILSDMRIGAVDLKVVPSGEKFILSGSVPSLLSRDLIEEVAASFVGRQYSVKGVVVAPPLVADDEIRNVITVSIPAHCQMDISQFKVSVHNGNVTLKGIAPALHHRWLAESLARGTKGVRNVNNEIQVVGERKSDQMIRENIVMIVDHRFSESELDDFGTTVNDGHVVLRGRLRSYADRKKIAEVVANVPGVVSVKNKLILMSPTTSKFRN